MAQKILAIVGGNSKGSLNRKLFNAVKDLAPAGIEVGDFDISTLPFFSQDTEKDPPQAVKDFKQKIKSADAFLFITPEYNRSIPGILKNAVDWGSRPYGDNSWEKKRAGVLGASAGNIGTFGAQNHLRQILAALDILVMAQPNFYFNGSKAFDEKGQLTDEKTKELIGNYWKAFSDFTK